MFGMVLPGCGVLSPAVGEDIELLLPSELVLLWLEC